MKIPENSSHLKKIFLYFLAKGKKSSLWLKTFFYNFSSYTYYTSMNFFQIRIIAGGNVAGKSGWKNLNQVNSPHLNLQYFFYWIFKSFEQSYLDPSTKFGSIYWVNAYVYTNILKYYFLIPLISWKFCDIRLWPKFG